MSCCGNEPCTCCCLCTGVQRSRGWDVHWETQWSLNTSCTCRNAQHLPRSARKGFPGQVLLLWRPCHSLPVWERAWKELLLGLVCHWDVLSGEDGDKWHHNSLCDRAARKPRNSWCCRTPLDGLDPWSRVEINYQAASSSPTLPNAQERRKWVQLLLLPEVGNGL